MSKRDSLRSTLGTVRYAEREGFATPDDVAKTQEMDETVRSMETKPNHAALDRTQRYEIPHDLLQMSMRSQEMPIWNDSESDFDEDPTPEIEWREFVAIVDPSGRIVLPTRLQQELRGKKLRVKFHVDEG